MHTLEFLILSEKQQGRRCRGLENPRSCFDVSKSFSKLKQQFQTQKGLSYNAVFGKNISKCYVS